MDTIDFAQYFKKLGYTKSRWRDCWIHKRDPSTRYIVGQINITVECLYVPSRKVQGIISRHGNFGVFKRGVWRILSYGRKKNVTIGPNNELQGLIFSKYNKLY